MLQFNFVICRKQPGTGSRFCPMHQLKLAGYLFEKSIIYQFLNRLQRSEALIQPQFVGLLIQGVLKFDTDPVIRLENRDFQVWMLYIADNAHNGQVFEIAV